MNSKISDKDRKDWEQFLSDNDPLPNKDNNYNNKKTNKTKSIDLHGYSLNGANETIKSFITQAYNEGVKKLIIVTGKGLHSENEKDPYISKDLGILKYSVPKFINGNQDLMKKIVEIKNANIEDGGSGAFYIYLRKKNRS